MVLRRDHIVGVLLLVLAGGALALSTDLPIGTPGSPGPGMVPVIAIGLIAAFSLALVFTARQSPPAAESTWSDLPHALSVAIAGALAITAYERAGFVITMAVLIVGVLVFIERLALWRALLYSALVVGGTKLLLATLLKSPLPVGPFGF